MYTAFECIHWLFLLQGQFPLKWNILQFIYNRTYPKGIEQESIMELIIDIRQGGSGLKAG